MVYIHIILSFIIFFAISEVGFRFIFINQENYNFEMWRYTSLLKEKDVELGHKHIPNKKAILQNVEIQTNNYGFRSNRDVRPTEKKRILVLGDSMSMGWGVPVNETYVELLQQMFDGEILNLSVGNYNIENYVKLLKKYISFKPDLVIIGFYINDIEKINYPSRLNEFLMRNSATYGWIMGVYFRLRYGKGQSYVKYYKRLYQDKSLLVRLEEQFQILSDIMEKNKIKGLFINIPETHHYAPYPFLEIHKKVETLARSLPETQYLDLLTYFRGKDPIKYVLKPSDYHYNKNGHKVVLEAIKEVWLKKEKK